MKPIDAQHISAQVDLTRAQLDAAEESMTEQLVISELLTRLVEKTGAALNLPIESTQLENGGARFRTELIAMTVASYNNLVGMIQQLSTEERRRSRETEATTHTGHNSPTKLNS